MSRPNRTLAVFTTHWRAVSAIICLQLLVALIQRLLLRFGYPSGWYPLLLLSSLLVLSLTLRAGLLKLGLLRAGYVDARTRLPALMLLRIGAHFLWRFFLLGLLYGLALVLAWQISIAALARLHRIDGVFSGLLTLWRRGIWMLVFRLILMKLILLLPALIIVRDCRVWAAFRAVRRRRYRLRERPTLIFWFCLSIALSFVFVCIRTALARTVCPSILFQVISVAVSTLIGLAVAIKAIEFVAGRAIGYDSGRAGQST